MKERLHKIIAERGIASRRKAEEMIRAGRVAVDGEIIREAAQGYDPDSALITVDGQPLPDRQQKNYVLFHKPPGCMCTLSDPQGRTTVADYFADWHVRLFPVGRLDWDSEGLLLLTNDGDLAFALTHPRSMIAKEYEVKVRGRPDKGTIYKLRSGGLPLADGPSPRAGVFLLKTAPQNTWLRIKLVSGRNRIIRRMCRAAGLNVIRLVRTRLGNLKLGDLPSGAWRSLSTKEVKQLWGFVASRKQGPIEPPATPHRRPKKAGKQLRSGRKAKV